MSCLQRKELLLLFCGTFQKLGLDNTLTTQKSNLGFKIIVKKMELIISVGLVSMMLVLSGSLLVLVQDISDKTIDYASYVNESLDCAYNGLPLSECNRNPVIFNISDINEYSDIINSIELKNKNG